jgi:hypothetical protein
MKADPLSAACLMLALDWFIFAAMDEDGGGVACNAVQYITIRTTNIVYQHENIGT